MRKIFLLLATVSWVAIIFIFVPFKTSKKEKDTDRYSHFSTARQDGILLAQQQEFAKTRDVSLNIIPKYKLVETYREQLRKRELYGVDASTAFTWTERGPSSDVVGPSNGNGRVTANQVTAGRLRTIWWDLADGTNETVWTGGIDGGLWKTTSISSDPSNWSLLTDMTANIAVSSIAQSPVDHNIMYFGTGEKSANVDAVRGGGVWKSTDHGVTWTLLNSTVNFWNVSKVVCDPTDANTVYVSTMGSNLLGIQRSTDGGNTWTNITPTGLNRAVTEMELSSTGRMHIVCGYVGTYFDSNPSGYRYTDAPATVTAGAWTAPAVSFTQTNVNVELAASGNTLYALPANNSYQTPIVWKSTNGGANWAQTTTQPAGFPELSSGQAWYNIGLGVDPADPDRVMVGGLNSYISYNGGLTWTLNSIWVTGYGPSANYIHADHHFITWNGNQVLNGGDGGIFYSNDAGATWSDRNVGLRLKQFYSVAVHPTSTNYLLGGTQDNGCHQLNGAGLTTSVEVTGGDGAFMHIDQDEPQYQFGAYVYSNFRRSTNGGASWSNVNFGNVGQFINPTDYDDIVNMLYGGWNSNQYLRWNNPQSGGSGSAVTIAAFNGAVTHVKVSPHTVNRVYFGTAGARIVRVDNANGVGTITSTNLTGTGMPASPNSVSCIAVGTSDNHLLATFSNYGLTNNRLWVSTVGGGSGGWTNITGDFPDIPVRWAMFYPNDNTKAILGTDLGIWETALINGAATNWVQDPNFPTVRVDMLQYRTLDGLLAAGTHGRGIWTTNIAASQPYVRFAFNYNYRTEASGVTSGCRRYTDYTVNMQIDKAPVGDAVVALTGSGVAEEGADYDFTTNGDFSSPSNVITFPSGSTTPQMVTIRIYNDAELESTETFDLTYSIGGGTDAVASPESSSYRFTILENDVAPSSGTNAIATVIGTNRTEYVGSNGSYYFYSGSDVILNLSGASADLGCVTANIFDWGNVWQNFDGGQRSQKVFEVTPTMNSGASYTVGLYFTSAELGGKTPGTLRVAKTTAATMAGANSTNTVIATLAAPVAYGSGYLYTASFTGFSKLFLVDAAVILPVELLTFTGYLDNKVIPLKWTTSSEQDSKEFIIEKSPDGSAFRPIGTLGAAGNSSTNRNYSFIDKQVDELNYYRLKMVDIDHKFSYSPIVLVKASGIPMELRVMTNPFRNQIRIGFTRLPREPVYVELIDMRGVKLFGRNMDPANQLTLDLAGRQLAPGTYILRVVADKKQFTKNLVRQ